MFESKTVLSSRTVWANAIGLLAIAFGVFGFDVSTLDSGAVAEAIVQIVAAVSFVASTVFRVVATKQLVK
ncbi:hypothetical protein [Microvirga flavescens]|uniref:hypothetical protein n=1 Tax=Microvirga flavescens TaxID=2249811 RepID=UPI000DDA8674|nr:hypothetical protein [Microvirga flavescens]